MSGSAMVSTRAAFCPRSASRVAVSHTYLSRLRKEVLASVRSSYPPESAGNKHARSNSDIRASIKPARVRDEELYRASFVVLLFTPLMRSDYSGTRQEPER